MLAKPVMRDNGQVLVAEGTQLTDSLVQRLANMGAETLVVKGSPLGGEGDLAKYKERVERIPHLFRRFEDDAWMQRVEDFLLDYFQQRVAAEEALSAMETADSDETADAEGTATGGTGGGGA